MGVILTGFLDVPPDRLEAVRAALPLHVRLSRAEPECDHFEVFESASVAGRFAVSERFATRAGFQAHRDRSAASDWGRVTRGLPRNYKIVETPD
ncbi:putative quinol monooxygenase [Sedimentitalea sp. HM32M-2]|uniref:putative quinol monooxygenase n=1 Tax=Sedimentitalea sp. HM32M-2 TaxID=3351566 RepID=UPI003643A413